MYFLGIDSNRQRTVVAALDLEQAIIVAEGVVEHQTVSDLVPGSREQDPATWISALDEAVRSCLAQLGPAAARVAGLGVSGQTGGTVILDSENRILRSAKLEGDLTMLHEMEELAEAFGGPPGMLELIGNNLSPHCGAVFLHWLKKHENAHFQKINTVFSPHDFLNYWLTGNKRTEFGDASTTGLMDVRSREWSRPLLHEIHPHLIDCLPPLSSSRGAIGRLRPDLATAWGVGKEVLVSAGGGQAMMESIGAGNVTPGGVTVSLGNQGRVSGVSLEPTVDPRGEVMALCDATDQWMPLVATSGATDPLEMVSATFHWNPAQLEEAVRQSTCGAGGLVFLPLADAGPGAEASAFLHGMTRQNYTANHLARAAAEGVALEFGHNLERICELGFEPKHVHVAGDWSRSEVWRQLVANVLGLPVAAAKGGDGPALGAALQAAVTYFSENGEDLSYQEITAYAAEPAEGSRCEPDEDEYIRYREILARRQYLAESLRGANLG